MGITDIKSLLRSKPLQKGEDKRQSNQDSSFTNFLEKEVQEDKNVRFSKHAQKRLEERKISMDGDEYLKLKDGIDKNTANIQSQISFKLRHPHICIRIKLTWFPMVETVLNLSNLQWLEF